jgi:rhodanese-related sulfurtransferase
MMHYVDPSTLKQWLHSDQELAVLDVREHGQYGESHLFLATSLPYSRLEYEIARLVPRKSVKIILYDEDGQGACLRAANALAGLGYTNLFVLEGGTKAWSAAGYTLFAGVNLPSKTFGELIEHHFQTPRITAQELMKKIQSAEDVIILDGRPQAEFKKMSIPGALCCPNGELSYRIQSYVNNPNTTIVVNCAGRTRSIIGAQTLINLGIPNPVFALENGTQGWYLQDFALDHGQAHPYAKPNVDERLLAKVAQLAERFAVPIISDAQFNTWATEADRSLYLCDVRTAEEFKANGLPGAQNTPGGQIIQATDQFIGVRHARIVVYDSDGTRAITVASWLKQMGHDVAVLKEGIESTVSLPAIATANIAGTQLLSDAQLVRAMNQGETLLLDLRPSMQYRKGHLTGAIWTIRPRLLETIANHQGSIICIVDDPAIAQGAIAELASVNRPTAIYLAKGAYFPPGLDITATPDLPADSDCIDYLFFVHDRHDGNKEAARRYLEWETGLVAQLDEQERNLFAIH